jgi:hypothetical protein
MWLALGVEEALWCELNTVFYNPRLASNATTVSSRSSSIMRDQQQ